MKETINFSLTVQPGGNGGGSFAVTDPNGNSVLDGGSIVLNDETVGVADTQELCTLSGGTAPYNVTLSAGALPDGINIDSAVNSDGSETLSFTGNPTTAETVDFSLDLSDAAGASVSLRAASKNVKPAARPAVQPVKRI